MSTDYGRGEITLRPVGQSTRLFLQEVMHNVDDGLALSQLSHLCSSSEYSIPRTFRALAGGAYDVRVAPGVGHELENQLD